MQDFPPEIGFRLRKSTLDWDVWRATSGTGLGMPKGLRSIPVVQCAVRAGSSKLRLT